jgi:hypothetical protein
MNTYFNITLTDILDIQKTQKHKCAKCNKKTGLLGFICRCNKIFCAKHRYPEEHMCGKISNIIDDQLEDLKKMNPQILLAKVDKI